MPISSSRRPSTWTVIPMNCSITTVTNVSAPGLRRSKVGVKAMPVAALVGFLIGVVLSYLSALQLKAFGADIYIVDILGLGIVRELGPVLVSVLVAGRSGSAMTAQLGVMRVTDEIDAMSVMGIPYALRLVLPPFALLPEAWKDERKRFSRSLLLPAPPLASLPVLLFVAAKSCTGRG